MQQPTDQSVGQRKDAPGQYLDIALVPRQYLDIALVAGQYKIYCPAMTSNLPTQSVTLIAIYNPIIKISTIGYVIEMFGNIIKTLKNTSHNHSQHLL